MFTHLLVGAASPKIHGGDEFLWAHGTMCPKRAACMRNAPRTSTTSSPRPYFYLACLAIILTMPPEKIWRRNSPWVPRKTVSCHRSKMGCSHETILRPRKPTNLDELITHGQCQPKGSLDPQKVCLRRELRSHRWGLRTTVSRFHKMRSERNDFRRNIACE